MTEDRQKRGIRAVNVGLSTNVLLAGLKTVIGVLGHSPALLADGINSTSDVAYYVVVRVLMHFSRKPADKEHPYGHSQVESIAAVVVGAFVVSTAIAIFWNAVSDVYDHIAGQSTFEGASPVALWIAAFTVAMKIGLMIYTRRVGQETENPAILALAQDHRNDIVAASGAGIGIFLGRAGLPWGDPLAGALVAVVVLKTGIDILRDASANLMDTVPSGALESQVRTTLLKIPGILDVEEVHAHRFGPYLVLNVTIGIEGDITVKAGDAIANTAEQTLCREIGFVVRTYIHYHPVNGARRGTCRREG
jgi:cation diffusion facilitator family transporter